MIQSRKEVRDSMKKIIWLPLLLGLLLAVTLTACQPSDDPAADSDTAAPTEQTTNVPTEENSDGATEEPTEAPTETPAAETTEAPTEPVTEAPKEITAGMMLYYEDFSAYGDIGDTEGAVNALGWKIQTTFDDYAYSDWTANLSIQNGQLTVNNYRPEEEFVGKDSYALMLDADYMTPIVEYGDYTLQYDVPIGMPRTSNGTSACSPTTTAIPIIPSISAWRATAIIKDTATGAG